MNKLRSYFSIIISVLGFLLVLQKVNTPVFAQNVEAPSHVQTYSLSSSSFNGGGEEALMYSNQVQVSGAKWLRVHFASANLGSNSYITLTSVQDGGQQRLNGITMSQWQNSSAYFNGDAVSIALHVGAGDQGISFSVDYVVVGDPNSPLGIQSQCGLTDDRVASNDPRVGRLMNVGCTAWLIPNGKLVTAGHCLEYTNLVNILEFNVPASSSDGTVRHPVPENQYAVNTNSFVYHANGIGDDWGVFEVWPNSNTGMLPLAWQGASFTVVQNLGPSTIRITGYGVDDGSANQTQQTATGPNAGSSGTVMRYVTDTEGGNSGGPIIDESTNNAVGVHTNGGCETDGTGYNSGTSAFNTVFWNALQSTMLAIVDQILEDGITTVDSVGYWETNHFQMYLAPNTFSFTIGTNEVLRSAQKIISGQKYNNWTDFSDVTNHHVFPITPTTPPSMVTNFKLTNSGIVIKTELLDAPTLNCGTVEFKDPWYVGNTSQYYESPYGYRNLGDFAIFEQRSSPFNPNTNPSGPGSEFKGVFLNQRVQDGVYYSVRAPQTQTIGNFTCVFDHWDATGADITSSTDTVTPVIFRSADAVVRAMYKATSASITVPIDSGWNMVSVPDTTNNMYKLSVYPYAQDQSVFTSNGGPYYLVDTLKVGKGYWINYPPNRLVTYSGKPAFKVGISLNTGWNMIGSLSTPIQISSIDTTIIYPSSFREYDSSGYHLTESIREGIGYWVKAKQAGTLWLDASSALSIPENTIAYQPPPAPGVPSTPALQAPINGATGISLAPILYWYPADGAVTYQLQVSASSTFSSTVFNQSGITATSKQIGTLAYSTRYYWRVNATNLSGTSNWSNIRYFTTESAPPPPTDPCLTTSSISTLDQFTVSDASGKRQTLYAKNGKIKLHGKFTDFDMPPEPVGEIFYVKFKSDKLLENIPPGMGFIKIPIKVKNAKYPITVNWKIKEENGVKYWISKSGNDNDKQPLSGNGSTGLSSTKDGDIIIIAQAVDPCEIVWKAGVGEGVDENSASIPTEHKLEQNIPNPFNPSSIVNYQLPIDNWVTLRVYNILGKEVATLVDGFEPAGYKSVNFDASSLPSGVYFYRMIAGSYTDVKKMMVAK